MPSIPLLGLQYSHMLPKILLLEIYLKGNWEEQGQQGYYNPKSLAQWFLQGRKVQKPHSFFPRDAFVTKCYFVIFCSLFTL